MVKRDKKTREKWVKVFLELMEGYEDLPREEESPCSRCPLRGLCG